MLSPEKLLTQIRVKAWRMTLDAGGRRFAPAALRRVWMQALGEVSPTHYQQLFDERNTRGGRRYVIRFAPRSDRFEIEFLLLGETDEALEAAAWEAWERAGCLGLAGGRTPFFVDRVQPLTHCGEVSEPSRLQAGFLLHAQATSPISPARNDACCLSFSSPLILRRGKRLLEPTLDNLAEAAIQRLCRLTDASHRPQDFAPWRRRCVSQVAQASWQGRRARPICYTTRQGQTVRLRGVVGELQAPRGLGELTPLLAAACWTHLGASTGIGLGRLVLQRAGSTEMKLYSVA